MARQSEFELLGRITIGQYLPTASPLHRLDPRAKLLMALLLVIAVVLTSSLVGQCLLLVAVLGCLALARVPLRFALAGIRSMVLFLALLALLQVFAIPQYSANARTLWHWTVLTVTDRSLVAGFLLVGRFSTMALGVSLFSFCTTTVELTHGVEHLLRPLQAWGLPAHEFALVLNIAIRFLPTLAEEAERLMKAQASRGAELGGLQGGPVRRARRMLPLLVPLFLVSLERAEQLIEAMEARCYLGGKGRTHLIQLRAQAADLVALTITVALAAAAVTCSASGVDRMVWRWIAGA
jgi:energy-coupling factor transport system permease protein